MERQSVTEAEIQRLLSKYLRERNKEAVSVLKMVKTKIATEKGRLEKVQELGEEAIVRIIKKEIKEIRDTIASLRKAGMSDPIAEEEKKIQVLEGLLPPSLDEQELHSIVEEAVRELGKENFGRIMKAVMGKVAGRADGKIVSDLVRKAISGP